MALPAGPAAHLVLVQPHLPFGRREGHLNRPAAPCHPDQVGQLGALRREDHVRLPVRGIAQTAPHQTPALKAFLQRRDEREARPVVPAGPFRPVARRPALPPVGG